MTTHHISLKPVSRDDVKRILNWIEDEQIAADWFGRYTYGDPAHLGYHPLEAVSIPDEKWHKLFDNEEHRIFSIYIDDNMHIGEIHVAVEESLGDGQISVLIGSKKEQHKGYGTQAVQEVLRLAFGDWGLYRVWVDVPEYNESATKMFMHLGFVHEGTLRKSRPHHGARFDSIVMGLLSGEYYQRFGSN